MKLQKFLLWLMSLAFAVCVCGCKDDDNSTEPNYKVVEGKLFQTTDGNTWQYVGKVIGDSVSNSLFKIDGEFLMISTDGTTWRSLGKVVDTNGITPLFDIKDGYWCVSYDNGKTWEKKDKATTEVSSGGVSKDTTTTSNSNSALCDANLVKGKFFYEKYDESDGGRIYEFREDGICYRTSMSREYFYYSIGNGTYFYYDTLKYVCDGNTIYTYDEYIESYNLFSDGEAIYLVEFDYGLFPLSISKDVFKLISKEAKFKYATHIEKNKVESILSNAKKIDEKGYSHIQVSEGTEYIAMPTSEKSFEFKVLFCTNKNLVIEISGERFELFNDQGLARMENGTFQVVDNDYKNAPYLVLYRNNTSIESPHFLNDMYSANLKEVNFRKKNTY